MSERLAAEIAAARADGRISTTSWTQLRSPEGTAIGAHGEQVLAVFARFIRNINPLQYSAGFLKLYESPEHEGMAGSIRLQTGPDAFLAASDPLPLSNGSTVAYEQTIALAGDFYGVPSAPISDGTSTADQQQRFRAAFATLDTGSPSQMTAILGVMQQQSDAITAYIQSHAASADTYSRAYSAVNKDHAYDKQYNKASGGSDGATWLFDQGSYMELAATNWDHFGNHAGTAYMAGHTVALQQARAAAGAPADQQEYLLKRAYLMEAFCAHFLADLFSSGHLRTPRKALHHDIDPFPDLLSQMMHDEDSYNGLMGTSSFAASSWPVYGDKRMCDPDNATNLAYARDALQASANEIYSAFTNPGVAIDPSTFAALAIAPSLTGVLDRANHQNWPALFYRDDGNAADPTNDPSDVEFRVPVTDLDSTSYMGLDTLGDLLDVSYIFAPILPLWVVALTDPYQHLAYFIIWLAVPAGGVHSLEGGPPAWLRQLNALAHPFDWAASYALTDASSARIPNIKAPSATVGISGIVDTNKPIDDATHQDDVLHVFYGQDSTNAVLHLTTPMSNVVNQSFAGVWSPGCSVETLNLSTTGGIAAIDTGGLITLVFPNSSGQLVQSIITPSGGLDSTGQRALFAMYAGSWPVASDCTPGLASIGETLMVAFRGSDNTVLTAKGTPGIGTAYYSWSMPSTVVINGKNLVWTDDPSLIYVDDDLYLSIGGRGSGGPFPIRIYRGQFDVSGNLSWSLFLNGLKDTKGNSIKTASFARLFSYGDGYGVVAKDPDDASLFTAVPTRTYAPLQAWTKRKVTVPNPQFTSPPTVLTQTTRSTPTAIFYGGNPYLFFGDQKTTDLSLVTSNPPLNAIR